MRRLFVAVELPSQTTAELSRIQPTNAPGIRLVAQNQMHLTLHFLGEADAERVCEVLSEVAAEAFPLSILSLGQFRSGDGVTTLWAGVQETPGLLELHAAIANSLITIGIKPEERHYRPHVTLARCEPVVPEGIVNEFINRRVDFSLPATVVSHFHLYSSEFVNGVPIYQKESTFQLPDAN